MKALGDRIAIMNEGLVKCCGTPMFLKKTFGAGYQLRISKNVSFRKDRVLTVVRNYMPNAEIKSEINSETIYSLESEAIAEDKTHNTSAVLAQLFSDLESRKTELGIESCGLTVTTMEDVFLRVGNEYNDNEMVTKNGRNGRNGSTHSDQERLFQSIPKSYGMDLQVRQFIALILKRFHYAKRYWPMVVMQTLIPSLLFMCILLLDKSMKTSFTQSVVDKVLNLKSLYGNTEGFLTFNDNGIQTQFEKIYTQRADSEGVTSNLITGLSEFWQKL